MKRAPLFRSLADSGDGPMFKACIDLQQVIEHRVVIEHCPAHLFRGRLILAGTHRDFVRCAVRLYKGSMIYREISRALFKMGT